MITDITNSDEVNKKLEERVNEKLARCQEEMFEIVDETKFREGLNLRSEEHTSELQSRFDLVCRLLLEKKKPVLGTGHRGLQSVASRIPSSQSPHTRPL